MESEINARLYELLQKAEYDEDGNLDVKNFDSAELDEVESLYRSLAQKNDGHLVVFNALRVAASKSKELRG